MASTKTVYLRLWTPDKRHVLLVKNLPELEPLPNGVHKGEGWGMVGGGQKRQDLENDITTAIRELGEETSLTADKITIDPEPSIVERRGNGSHTVIVYDATYYTDDISTPLRPNDPKGQITEARWVNFMNLLNGTVDDLKIYKTHLRMLNDEPNPYSAR